MSTLTLDELPMYLLLTLVDISTSTYLPHLVNVVIECPPMIFVSAVNFRICNTKPNTTAAFYAAYTTKHNDRFLILRALEYRLNFLGPHLLDIVGGAVVSGGDRNSG